MRRFLPWLGLLLALVVTFFAYQHGLRGAFLFDDHVNIVDNTFIRIDTLTLDALRAAAYSVHTSLVGRPVSMASFALDYYFQGAEPYGFKLTNLIIHLINGALLYVLTTLLLGVYRSRYSVGLSPERLRWIAVAVAMAWTLHPLNLTPVLYVVQRMTSLSALFTLLGMIFYVYGRLRQVDGLPGWRWILPAFFMFTPLAVLSKENGLLLPAFLLLIEVLLLNFQMQSRKAQYALWGLFAATVILPAALLLGSLIIDPTWLTGGYANRDFTMQERLMTEGRVIGFYLQQIMVPDIAKLGLHHDDFEISRGWLSPATTLLAWTGLGLAAAAALWFRKSHPIAAFGIIFFLLGHSIESTVIALEIAHEHRNYLPDYGILLVFFYYLLSNQWHRDTLKIRQMLAVILLAFFGGVTTMRANQWADQQVRTLMEVKHHPDSVRANTEAAYLYVNLPFFSSEQFESNYQQAKHHYQKAADLTPTGTAGLFGLIGLNSRYGYPVEEHWVRELESRLEHNNYSPDSSNSLMKLEQCLTSRNCTHSVQVMDRLLQAALRNPKLSGIPLSTIQFARSNFLYTVIGDHEGALTAASKALDAAYNDPETRIIYLSFLIIQQHPDQALKRISEWRPLDEMKVYGARLDEFEANATRKNN